MDDGKVACFELLTKVIILGDATVGKTSFVTRYIDNSPPRDYKMTVGVDFGLKILQWRKDLSIRVQLWDIAGQDRFHSLMHVYYKGTNACLILFDLANRQSFSNALLWKNNLDSQCHLPDGGHIPCLLVANKSDLKDRQVEEMEIINFANENGFLGWKYVSVLKNTGLEEAMRCLMEAVVEQNIDSGSDASSSDPNIVSLSKSYTSSTQSDRLIDKCGC